MRILLSLENQEDSKDIDIIAGEHDHVARIPGSVRLDPSVLGGIFQEAITRLLEAKR